MAFYEPIITQRFIAEYQGIKPLQKSVMTVFGSVVVLGLFEHPGDYSSITLSPLSIGSGSHEIVFDSISRIRVCDTVEQEAETTAAESRVSFVRRDGFEVALALPPVVEGHRSFLDAWRATAPQCNHFVKTRSGVMRLCRNRVSGEGTYCVCHAPIHAAQRTLPEMGFVPIGSVKTDASHTC